MLRSVATKTLYEQRRSLLGWAISLVAVVAVYAAVWPSVRDQPSMQDFLDKMPEAYRALFAASGADMTTPVGYVQVELLSFLAPTLLLIYAIIAGAGLAVEEDRRTLDALLANPIGRGRLVLERLAAMVVGTFALSGVLTLALILGGPLVDLRLPAGKVVAAMLHLTLLALVFGALALTVAAASGRPGISRSVPAMLAVLAYVLNGLGLVVSWLESARPISPFYQFSGHDPLRTGVSLPAAGVALATIAVLTVAAVLAFRRRDISA